MQVELLATVKTQRKLSNKWIAEETGLSESTISRILSRQIEPKFEDVVRIAIAVGVSLDALAGIVRIEAEQEAALRAALEEKEVQMEAMKQDYMVLANYVKGYENGIVGAKNSPLLAKYENLLMDYATVNGSGRITIK